MKSEPQAAHCCGRNELERSGLDCAVAREGYTDKATIPTKGDVPTIGFGSTVRDDGTRVQMGDTTTPQRALRTVQAHLSREENAFRESLPGVTLTQGEYDLYIDFAYQYGIANWNKGEEPVKKEDVDWAKEEKSEVEDAL